MLGIKSKKGQTKTEKLVEEKRELILKLEVLQLDVTELEAQVNLVEVQLHRIWLAEKRREK